MTPQIVRLDLLVGLSWFPKREWEVTLPRSYQSTHSSSSSFFIRHMTTEYVSHRSPTIGNADRPVVFYLRSSIGQKDSFSHLGLFYIFYILYKQILSDAFLLFSIIVPRKNTTYARYQVFFYDFFIWLIPPQAIGTCGRRRFTGSWAQRLLYISQLFVFIRFFRYCDRLTDGQTGPNSSLCPFCKY